MVNRRDQTMTERMVEVEFQYHSCYTRDTHPHSLHRLSLHSTLLSRRPSTPIQLIHSLSPFLQTTSRLVLQTRIQLQRQPTTPLRFSKPFNHPFIIKHLPFLFHTLPRIRRSRPSSFLIPFVVVQAKSGLSSGST